MTEVAAWRTDGLSPPKHRGVAEETLCSKSCQGGKPPPGETAWELDEGARPTMPRRRHARACLPLAPSLAGVATEGEEPAHCWALLEVHAAS